MSDKDDIAKAMAKMEAEAAKIEAHKNRERHRLIRQSQAVVEKNRLAEIDQENKEDHKNEVSKLKFGGIFIFVSSMVMLIYVISLSEKQRALLVEDTIFWSLGVGMVLIALLKK